MTQDLVDLFTKCWSSSKPLIDADTISSNSDLAFVYLAPFSESPLDDAVSWAQNNVHDWTRLFRRHFKSSSSSDKPVRRKLQDKEASEWDSMETLQTGQDPTQWRNMQPWSVQAFEWCLHQIKVLDKAEYISCVIPPILQLAEDHEIEARLAGARCLLRLVTISHALVARMGLADLILQILKTNLSFHERPELVTATIACLDVIIEKYCTDVFVPGWKIRRLSPQYFDLLDAFLEIVMRDLGLSKPDQPSFEPLLAALARIIELEELGAVRYLSELVPLLVDLTNLKEASPGVFKLQETLQRTCHPRMQHYKPFLQNL